MIEPEPAPTPAPLLSEAAAEALLRRAVALGRRDGLAGPEDRPAWPRAALLRPLGTAEAAPPLLLLALRQCYAAGHRHGSDVRREKARRRA
ncbi:hypothetical protein [Pseudoroseomonas cervicalis]|uniref:hypothetical protein n=1 Tax=Teichococcus cervicalis TaxID=204525 RepID=UPI0027848B9B|nr:hypothetical protein [Pseudoroseomonas cervicalis]MDQ1077545.1 hypothetical protein [Pseudoroseomonas cervicalis]